MKRKIWYIVPIVLLIISIILNIFQFTNKNKCDANEYKLIECQKIEQKENYQRIEKSIIKYDNIGRAMSEKFEYIDKYNSAEEYNFIKDYKTKNKDYDYKFFDDDYSIIESVENLHNVDENNNEQFVWVRHIINNYTTNGYTCKNVNKE